MFKTTICIIASLLLAGSLGTACNGASSASKPVNPASFVAVGTATVVDSMPTGGQPAAIAFRDMNAYTSDGYFCIVSIVDNASDTWQRLWVQTELLDASGNTLTVNGKTTLLLETFSEAVPPRGATAFFCSIPLDQVSGVPVNCRLEGAGSVERAAGPILVVTEVGGVRAMYPDPNNPEKIVEKTFNVQVRIENPLDLVASHPKMVLLVYGKDLKLYFAQAVDINDPNAPVKQERSGPLLPQEKRGVSCLIQYDNLPTILHDLLIGRVDVQVHESR